MVHLMAQIGLCMRKRTCLMWGGDGGGELPILLLLAYQSHTRLLEFHFHFCNPTHVMSAFAMWLCNINVFCIQILVVLLYTVRNEDQRIHIK